VEVGGWIAVIGAAVAIFGSIGATIRWVHAQFKAQGEKVQELERKYAKMFLEHSLLLVKLERFRLAFRLVAAELRRISPANKALLHAAALLDDAFKFDADIPPEMQDLLNKIDEQDGGKS